MIINKRFSIFPCGWLNKENNVVTMRQRPQQTQTIEWVYQYVSSECTHDITERLRSMADEPDDVQREFKLLHFEYATFSGIFSYRNARGLAERSPYLVLDIDDLASMDEAVALISEKRQQEEKRHLKAFVEDAKLEVIDGRYGPYLAYDGKNVNMAGLSCELHAYPGAFTQKPIKRCSAIGLFVHEFGHALGLPDLYPNSPNASLNNGSLEYWDVMDGGEYKDNGGYTPPPYTAYERQSLDWFSIDTLRENGEYSLLPLDEGGKAYYILADSTRYAESYILENVQNRGWGYWGTTEAFQGNGHGLMIIHAYNIDKEFKRGILPNNYPGERYTVAGKTLSGADTTYIRYRFNSHYHCMSTDTILLSSEWILRDYFGTYYTMDDYDASMMAVPFPGPGNVTTFNATSVSKAWIYQGDGLMHKSLYDISENDLGEVSFRFETDRPDHLPALHWNDGTEGLKDRLPCYNLQGMPVDADYRGWVIQGGKIRLLK